MKGNNPGLNSPLSQKHIWPNLMRRYLSFGKFTHSYNILGRDLVVAPLLQHLGANPQAPSKRRLAVLAAAVNYRLVDALIHTRTITYTFWQINLPFTSNMN